MNEYIAEGFNEELEKLGFDPLSVLGSAGLLFTEAVALWDAEAINAKNLMDHGTKVALGEEKKNTRAKVIEWFANKFNKGDPDAVAKFTQLPTWKKPWTLLTKWHAPLTAPYNIGLKKGEIIKKIQNSPLPEDTAKAIRSVMSVDITEAKKGEKYFEQLATDLKQLSGTRKPPEFMVKVTKDLLSADPNTRNAAIKKVQKYKRVAIGGAVGVGALAAVGLGSMVYGTVKAIRNTMKKKEEKKVTPTTTPQQQFVQHQAGVIEGIHKQLGLSQHTQRTGRRYDQYRQTPRGY